jgi:hypothetical protein
MTKFETILRLAEIKGLMRRESGNVGIPSAFNDICDLIDDLSAEEIEDVKEAECNCECSESSCDEKQEDHDELPFADMVKFIKFIKMVRAKNGIK